MKANSWDFRSFLIYSFAMIICMVLASPKVVVRVNREVKKHENGSVGKYRLMFSFIPMLILLALRDVSRGGDLEGYFYKFNSLSFATISEVFSKYYDGEPLFRIYELILSRIAVGLDPNLKLIVFNTGVAFLWVLFAYNAVKNESQNIDTSLALSAVFIQLFFTSFSMLRQIIAISIMLYAFTCLAKGQRRRFWILTVLASGFHYTAIIGVAAYFFTKDEFEQSSNKVRNITFKIIVFLFMALFFVYGSNILDSVFGHWESKYALLGTRRTSWGIGHITKRLPLILLLYYYKNDLVDINSNNKLYIQLVFFDLFVSQLNYVNPSFNRLDLYFSAVYIFIIPSLYELTKRKFGSGFAKLIFTIVVIVWLVYKIRYYIYTTPYYIMPYFTSI